MREKSQQRRRRWLKSLAGDAKLNFSDRHLQISVGKFVLKSMTDFISNFRGAYVENRKFFLKCTLYCLRKKCTVKRTRIMITEAMLNKDDIFVALVMNKFLFVTLQKLLFRQIIKNSPTA